MDTPSAHQSVTLSIDEAIRIIGKSTPPTTSLEADNNGAIHVERLSPHMANPAVFAVAEILQSRPVRCAFKSYLDTDAEAERAQKVYIRARVYTVLPFALALCFVVAAFFLKGKAVAEFLGGLLGREDDKNWIGMVEIWFRHAIPFLVYAGLAATPFIIWRTRPNELFEGWKQSRGQAEAWRCQLFERVIRAEPREGISDADRRTLLQLKLEYFRRYQIDVQYAYFEKRRSEHMRVVWRTRILQRCYIAVAVIWCVAVVLALFSASEEQGLVGWVPDVAAAPFSYVMSWFQVIETSSLDNWLLISSALFAAAYGFALYHSLLSGAARNAARFKPMQENFNLIGKELVGVRNDAAQGNDRSVRVFVRRVHSIMAVELADWVRLADLDAGKDDGSTVAQSDGTS